MYILDKRANDVDSTYSHVGMLVYVKVATKHRKKFCIIILQTFTPIIPVYFVFSR